MRHTQVNVIGETYTALPLLCGDLDLGADQNGRALTTK
jgi:hypothetical protein